MRVLVAEDSRLERLMLQRSVESLGHECIVAEDGVQAWEMVEAIGADVIISDWLMPRLEGPELCRLVRSRPGTPYIYFIFVTALSDKEHALAGMRTGADDYLTKPLDLDDLEARLIAAARVTVLHRRREALLRIARRFAVELAPGELLSTCLQEAIGVVGADVAAIYSCEQGPDRLMLTDTLPLGADFEEARWADDGIRLAVERRAPVLITPGAGQEPVAVRPGVVARSTIAMPLLYEGRVLGALSVATVREGSGFTAEDVEVLEVLAGLAAAALTGLERAQLVTVALAARELAHLLNNDLAAAIGGLEMIHQSGELSRDAKAWLAHAEKGLESAERNVRKFQQVARVVTKETPVGPALDLERSTRLGD